MAQARKKPAKAVRKAKPVADVAPPGAASTTSRAIITKHQVMPDPMVTAQPNGEPEPATAPPVKRTKVVITPLHDIDRDGLIDTAARTTATKIPVATDADATTAPTLPTAGKTTFIDDQIKKAATRQPQSGQPAPSPSKAATPVAVTAQPPEPAVVPTTIAGADAAADEPAAKPVPPVVTGPPPKPVAASIDMVVAPPDPSPPADPVSDETAEIAKTNARQEHHIRIQKLIDEGEYFLPIETSEERRSRQVIWFGILLILVLAIAWYDVALDTSLLPNTYNLPHTNIFRIHG